MVRLLALALVAGCSARPLDLPEWGDGGAAPPDLMVGSGGHGHKDMTVPPDGDLSQPRDGSTPPPMSLMAGQFGLYGVTSDGQLIAYSFQNSNVYSISPTTGQATLITTADYATVRGNVVFLFNAAQPMQGIYKLSSWTKSAGVRPLSQSVSTVIFAPELSLDGQRAIYFDNVNQSDDPFADGGFGDLVISGLDRSNRQVVATNVPTGQLVNTGECIPFARGLDAGFAIAYCNSDNADAGTGIGEVVTVDAGGTVHRIVKDSPFTVRFTLDGSASHGFTLDQNQAGLVFDLAGTITQVSPDHLQNGRFAPDGSLIYLSNTDNALYQYSLAQATSTQLTQFGKFTTPRLFELAPDGSSALISLELADPTSPDTSSGDLWTVSMAMTNGPLSAITTQTDALPIASLPGYPASSYSRDSSYVFFLGPISLSYSGPLGASAANGGGSNRISDLVRHVLMTRGTHAVICSNLDPATLNCDLLAADGASGSTQTLDTKVVNYGIYLSPDGNTLYYTVNDGARSGIYSLPVP
jgi:hypothetical protein